VTLFAVMLMDVNMCYLKRVRSQKYVSRTNIV